MQRPPRIWHLIDRLDGYGSSRRLAAVARRQAAAGRAVEIIALVSDRSVAAELAADGIAVEDLRARGRWDPFALVRLAALGRKRMRSAEEGIAWDERALGFGRVALGGRLRLAPVNRAPIVGVSDVGGDPSWTSTIDVRAELELDPGTPLIATIGPLERRKRIDNAVWCYELVRILFPHARLVVIGDGPDRERLERLALAISDPECIRFLGYRADAAHLLAQFDVLWQLDPATFTPLAVLEALAAGTPVVACDAPGHRAVIEHRATGMLVPLAGRADVARETDALWRDGELKARVVAAGRDRVARLIEEAKTQA